MDGTRTYYRAALLGLAFVEGRQPTGRRFGPEADARWSSLRGDLTAADRIDLLVRDADAQWPGAFGPRTVFGLGAVAEDEPFGAGWESLDAVEAEEAWRAVQGGEGAGAPRALLEGVARAWGLALVPFDVGAVGAAERLVVAGPSAIAAVVEAFAERTGLDWADQVTVVATPPGHRQLAALGGAVLRSTKRTRLGTSEDATAPRGARVVLSQDAAPADAARARGLGAA